MARGSSTANTGAQAGVAQNAAYAGNAENIFSDLAPQLMAESAHPAGMNPADLAAENTGAQQSAGGTMAAAVGQGALRSARTRNAGGADAAVEASSRHAGEQLSNAGLQTRLKNAALKISQQENAQRGLGNLFSSSAGAGNQALGETAANVNASTEAENASWDWSKDLFAPILSAAGGASKGPLAYF